MKNTGGGRAWKFLKKNPGFILDWWMLAAGVPPAEGEPFPIRTQTAADLEAAHWGLLVWEDPLSEDGPASPFWSVAPTLEAVAAPGAPVFAEFLETPGVRLSGVRMASGSAMVLKIEQGEAAVQLRIADADAFDIEGGVALLTPAGSETPARLRRAADLWPAGAAKAKRPVSGCPNGSFCWRSR